MTFFLIATFMLLVFWRPQEWLFPFLYGLNLLDGIFYLAILVFLMELRENRLRFDKRAPQIYLLIGLWFAAMMSHIANTYLVGLIGCIIPTFKFCFFTVVLYCVLDRPSRLLLVGRMFVLMAITMAIHAYLQQARGYGFAWHPVIVDDKGCRSLFFGIFEDPNDLAQMFVTSIPFSFVFFRRGRFLNLLFGSLVTWFLVSGVFWTRSRGGMVALCGLGAFMLMLTLPARWVPYVAAVGGLSTLLLGPLAAGLLDDSAHDRIAFWGTANWAFKRRPLFGIGYGMMAEYLPKARAVHSAFVLCYTELGVFGYWFWFSLLQLGAVGCWRVRRVLGRARTGEARWFRSYAGMALCALVGFAASGYFLTRAFVYPAFFVFALTGAVPWVAKEHIPEEDLPIINIKKDLYVMCSLGVIGSITYIYFSIIMLNKAWMM